MVSLTHKNELQAALVKAFDNFNETFLTFTEDAVNQVLVAGSWTPAQVVVHIIKATDGVPDRNTSPAHRAYDANLVNIRPWWEDMSQKFTSPEPLRPDDQPRSKKELLDELSRVRSKDLALIAKTDLTQVCLDLELPSVGYLTRYEWLWFIEMHLKRHAFQLNNMLKQVV